MSKTVNVSELTAPRLPEQDVEVPGVGTVRIRSLSRAQVLEAKGHGGLPIEEIDRKLLVWALVAPKLTEDAARRWQEAATAAEIEPVTEAIMTLSGLNDDSAKQAVKQFRD